MCLVLLRSSNEKISPATMEERREDASSIDSASGSSPDQISGSVCILRESEAGRPKRWPLKLGKAARDSHSDIIWRHNNGQVYIWEMDGLQITAEGAVAHAPVPSDWHIFSQHNFV
jgi:hypothetical protein